MKRAGIYFVSAAILLFCTCQVQAQDVRLEAKLGKSSILIGEQTTFRISARYPVREKITFPLLTDTLTSKILIIGSGKADTLIDQRDKNYHTVGKTFTITSFDAGSNLIPRLVFKTANDSIKTDVLLLLVESVKVDTTKAIYDIKQPIAVSYSFFDWLRDNFVLVVLAILCFAAFIGLIIYLLKRPKPVPVVKEEPVPTVPFHLIFLQKLEELKAKKLWQKNEVKLYHSELSDLVREYLEQRYAIKTQEKTTEEIFAGLRYSNISADNMTKLRQILLLADLVKFAKEKPLPSENEMSIENAISFVLNTSDRVVNLPEKEGGSHEPA